MKVGKNTCLFRLLKQVASRALRDAEGEGAEPIVVVGSDTIVDVRAVIACNRVQDDAYSSSCDGTAVVVE